MNSIAFIGIAVFTLTMGVLAAILPKLMHAALSLAVMFIGAAAFFFLLGAEFVGLVQIFVYVGAVAVLIVFTILLTRRERETHRGFNWNGVVIAVAVFGALLWAILMMPSTWSATPAATTTLTIRQIGEALLTDYVWPL